MNKTVRNDRGGVFAEFAVVFPLFIFLVMSLFDTTRALNHYFLLSRIAYESTRLATGMVGLEAGSYSELTVPPNSVHQALQAKIKILIATYTGRIELADIALVTNHIESSNSVEVTVKENFIPMFLQVSPRIPITSTVSGPYLLQDSTVATPTPAIEPGDAVLGGGDSGTIDAG